MYSGIKIQRPIKTQYKEIIQVFVAYIFIPCYVIKLNKLKM